MYFLGLFYLFILEQIFAYVVILDFESTCWKEKAKGYNNEISKYFVFARCT